MIKFSQIVQWDPLQAGSCVTLIISIVFGVLLVVHEDALGSFCAPQAWSHPHQEKTLEHPLDCQEIQLLHPKGNHSWVFIGRTDAEVETPIFLATWCKERTHWKRPWCWERLKAGGDRGWDGWMASSTRWTWVWVNSGSWWWTGRPGMLHSMGSQRVRHDWATELKFSTHLNKYQGIWLLIVW